MTSEVSYVFLNVDQFRGWSLLSFRHLINPDSGSISRPYLATCSSVTGLPGIGAVEVDASFSYTDTVGCIIEGVRLSLSSRIGGLSKLSLATIPQHIRTKNECRAF